MTRAALITHRFKYPGAQLRSAAKTNRGEKKLRRQWGPAPKTSEEGLYASYKVPAFLARENV